MVETFCLTPMSLAAFIGLLDPTIIEPKDEKILIHAEKQTVEWIYIEDLNMFAIDGDRSNCGVEQQT